MAARITFYLDTRREKKTGYPIKIQVWDGVEQKLFPSGVDMTSAEFTLVESGKRLSKDLQGRKDQLDKKLVAAKEIASKMEPFNMVQFAKKYKQPVNSVIDVFHYFRQKAQEMRDEERIKTAIVYDNSSDSFRKFLRPGVKVEKLREDKSLTLPFKQVDAKFLHKYQKWMTDQGNSLTTVSMYLRALRAVFNLAIFEKEISPDLYPFTKDGYQIPTGDNVKQALEKEDLRKLRDYQTEDELIIKARDFWFFIYSASGMNIRDVINLKTADIKNGKLSFVREKTKNTTKREVRIEVVINKHMEHVIKTYGVKGPYVFDVLTRAKTATERVKASDAFVTFINDHMERLAKLCKVEASVTTYAARHSFGTIAIRNGAPMEFVQEALGHQSLSTTQNYFKGFDDTTKKEVSEKLMDF